MTYWDFFLVAGAGLLVFKWLMELLRDVMLDTYTREVESYLRALGFIVSDSRVITYRSLASTLYRDGKKRTRTITLPNGLLRTDPQVVAEMLAKSFDWESA